MDVTIDVQLLTETAKLPTRGTAGAAGWDLYASESAVLWVNDTTRIATGLAMALPPGWEAQVRPRSGLSAHGVIVTLGTVDSDYRGEVSVVMTNHSGHSYPVSAGDRIAQLVFARVPAVSLRQASELDATERGAGGFGSTGR